MGRNDAADSDLSAHRIAGSICILFPLLDWAQRERLQVLLFDPTKESDPNCRTTTVLRRISDFFDPTDAVLRGTERCSGDILELLTGADDVTLHRVSNVIADLVNRIHGPECEPTVDAVVLECLGQLVRSSLAEGRHAPSEASPFTSA
jgi:hypothetical protein